MKAVGIIAEFNPFHNGHRFILNHAKHKSQAEVLIAIMSGNFLQRGEPAIINKWRRTQAALANGADLVIELPYTSATESAENFARGGVQLLHDLQCDALCFGTEEGDTIPYEALALFYQQQTDRFDELIQERLAEHYTYPNALTAAWEDLTRATWPDIDFRQPNVLLGLQYALANQQNAHPMRLLPLNRIGAQHSDDDISHELYASGTAIRSRLIEGNNMTAFIPENTQQLVKDATKHTWEDYWPLLHYQLLLQTPTQLKLYHGVSEGIEYRLVNAAKKANSFSEWLRFVKTKRYTVNRIQRIALNILMQLTETDFKEQQQKPYHHLLGMSKKGQAYLQHSKKTRSFPVVATFSKAPPNYTLIDERATTLYQLPFKQITANDYTHPPIRTH